MASQRNVDLEAAKFLHKAIQDSPDGPAKLITKIYIILQHMKFSGKEHSIAYQVLSRDMEDLIAQNNFDIEVLKSSPISFAGTPHDAWDAAVARVAGRSTAAGVAKDSQAGLAENETAKIDAFGSSRPPVGSSSTGHDMNQGSVSLKSGGESFDHESPPNLETRSANPQSQEWRDSAIWDKRVNEKDSEKSNAKRKRSESSQAMESHIDNLNLNLNQLGTRNSVVNPRKREMMTKADSPGSFSVKGGEITNFDKV